jgi:sulfur carrier protein ThiS
MKVTLKLFATLSDCLPQEAKKTNSLEVELVPGTTIDQVIERFQLPRKLVHLVLVNGTYVPAGARSTQALVEGDTLAIWPPIAGG